ncbi:MAG TPA: glycosyltransferase family 39 protein [Patescibacteria group bacterium]|nr:glycosyltransferase family 39 protein [Patescibacteria group bacterium]
MWLLILGILARLWRFGQIPNSLYWDEAAVGLDARSLIATGKDLAGNSWFQPLFYSYGDYKAPVYIWLTTLFGFIQGEVSELTVRLPSLLAFAGTALVFYKLLKLVAPKSNAPWLALVSLAIMPWSIHFSRIGMESNLSLFWLTLTVYLAVLAVKSRRYFWLLGAGLAVVLGTFSYINLRLVGPFLLAAVLSLWPASAKASAGKPVWAKRLPYLIGMIAIIGLGFWWLAQSPNYAVSQQYRLSNNNLLTSVNYINESVTAMTGDYSFVSKLIHHRFWYWLKDYLINYSKHFEPKFLFVSGDPNLRHHSGFGGQLLLIQLPLLLLGLLNWKTMGKRFGGLMLGWLIISPVAAALVNEVPHASRAIYLSLPLAWLIGLGWSKLKPPWQTIVSLLLLVNLLVYMHDYFNHFPSRSALAWIKPYKDIALQFKDQPPTGPVYISPKLYKPELYFAFYLNDLSLFKTNDRFYYYLPDDCPQGAICVESF